MYYNNVHVSKMDACVNVTTNVGGVCVLGQRFISNILVLVTTTTSDLHLERCILRVTVILTSFYLQVQHYF